MADVFTPEKRSSIMSKVRGTDTKPEMLVRSFIHRMGYRFRLHRADLPGTPDIVLPKHRKVVLVHGCFWHQHPGCKRASIPKTNSDFWRKKLDRNVERDAEIKRQLRRAGWKVAVVWECETKDETRLRKHLRRFLNSPTSRST